VEHNISISGNSGTVTLEGRFTFADNKLIREILENFNGDVKNCTMDVSKLEFVDSAGLGMFILANDTITENGGKFVLRRPIGQVKKMLELTRFGDIISVEE